MADLTRVAEALTILARCGVGEISARHDELLAGTTGEVGDADRRALNDLGWSWDSDEDCWRRFT